MLDDLNNRRRELSWLVAALLLSCVLSFMLGYFIGHRAAARTFVDAGQDEIVVPILDEMAVPPLVEKNELVVTHPISEVPVYYYAEIATIDSYALVTQLVEQAAKVGVSLRIKKATRVLSRGRRKRTYKMVTGRYQSRDVLERDIATLKTIPAFAKIDSNHAIKQGK